MIDILRTQVTVIGAESITYGFQDILGWKWPVSMRYFMTSAKVEESHFRLWKIGGPAKAKMNKKKEKEEEEERKKGRKVGKKEERKGKEGRKKEDSIASCGTNRVEGSWWINLILDQAFSTLLTPLTFWLV